MNTTFIEALKAVCRLANADQDMTRRIIGAVKHEAVKPDTLITTKQVAAILQCHPKSVLRYARQGMIQPVRRSARCLRWRKGEVERLAYGMR